MNSKRVMELLGIGKKAFDNLVHSGILNPMKVGDGFKFPLWAIEEFQRKYCGYDLTTFEQCVIAKEKVDLAESTKNKKI